MNKLYFKQKNFELYLGDSIETMKSFDAESFDMIFADPPYNLSNGGFTVQSGRRASVNKGDWDKSKGFENDYKFHFMWINECKRLLKPNGTIWISGTYHSIYQCGHALQSLGYHILNDIAWYKPNAAPNLSCRYFTASHETLIWARKNKNARHVYNYLTMKDWKGNYKKKFKCYYMHKDEYKEILHEQGKQMRSVWAILTPSKDEKQIGKHPTQKPIELLKRIVLSSTSKGSRILDPFTGSSTTGIVALLEGRNFTGIDISREYLDMSIKRYKMVTNVNR